MMGESGGIGREGNWGAGYLDAAAASATAATAAGAGHPPLPPIALPWETAAVPPEKQLQRATSLAAGRFKARTRCHPRSFR